MRTAWMKMTYLTLHYYELDSFCFNKYFDLFITVDDLSVYHGTDILYVNHQTYCYEFWPARRAIGHSTRMATDSPTGTDNSVAALLV